MRHRSLLQNEATFQSDLNNILHQVLDVLGVMAVFGIGISMVRTVQLDDSAYMWNAALVIAGVFGGFFFRAEKYLAYRGLFLVGIHLVATGFGIFKLGLLTPGLYALPFFIALGATLFNRVVTALLIAGTAGLLVLAAVFHGSGGSTFLNGENAEWNANPRNWFVAIFSVFAVAFLMVYLVRRLTSYWKEADSKTSLTAKQLDAIVEHAPDAIFIIDVDADVILSANSKIETLFGVARGEIDSFADFMKYSPERQPCGELSADLIRKHMQKVLETGHHVFDWTHQNANGEQIPCEVSNARMPPLDRTVIQTSVRDVSRRVEQQEYREELQTQLAASQRRDMIGQLTGGVAHDFNNLLAVILGNLELSLIQKNEDTKHTMIQTSIDAALRGADLTRSMLAFARQATLQPKVIDMNRVLTDTKKWSSRTLPANIEVETSLLARLWKVEADPTNTESALLNLILNARDAMPDGGKLTIETSNVRIEETYRDGRNEEILAGRYVMVAVSDTGTGITEENIDKIFDPFFTTKPTGQGTGLGLAMALGFMRQSGGTAQVYSEVGVGTTFKLYFPAVLNDTDYARDSLSREVEPLASGTKILVVEDEEAVLAIVKNMLESANYTIDTATTGDEAKRMFQANPDYDLLLTDIVMPGQLQGTTLAKELRALEPNLPVVFMSGYAAEATVHGNGLRPEDIRLMKPVLRRDLLAAVARAVRNSRPAG